jgi:hypothetical protein
MISTPSSQGAHWGTCLAVHTEQDRLCFRYNGTTYDFDIGACNLRGPAGEASLYNILTMFNLELTMLRSSNATLTEKMIEVEKFKAEHEKTLLHLRQLIDGVGKRDLTFEQFLKEAKTDAAPLKI